MNMVRYLTFCLSLNILFIFNGCTYSCPKIDFSKHTSEKISDFGVVYEEANKINDAAVLYKKAIEKNPCNYVALTNLGNILYKKGMIEDSVLKYESALKHNPDYIPALNNLGNLLMLQKDYENAEIKLKLAYSISNEKREQKAISNSLGVLYIQQGNEIEAEKWFNMSNNIKLEYIIDDVPFFQQIENGCGPSALASIYNFLGIKQSPAQISERIYNKNKRGTLNLRILIDAREQGLEASIYSGSIEDIKASIDYGIPIILMINSGYSCYHYIIVIGYKGIDMSSLVVHDGYNRNKIYSKEFLLKSWELTNYCTISIQKAFSQTFRHSSN